MREIDRFGDSFTTDTTPAGLQETFQEVETQMVDEKIKISATEKEICAIEEKYFERTTYGM